MAVLPPVRANYWQKHIDITAATHTSEGYVFVHSHTSWGPMWPFIHRQPRLDLSRVVMDRTRPEVELIACVLEAPCMGRINVKTGEATLFRLSRQRVTNHECLRRFDLGGNMRRAKS